MAAAIYELGSALDLLDADRFVDAKIQVFAGDPAPFDAGINPLFSRCRGWIVWMRCPIRVITIDILASLSRRRRCPPD